MRKIISLLIAGALVFTGYACGKKKDDAALLLPIAAGGSSVKAPPGVPESDLKQTPGNQGENGEIVEITGDRTCAGGDPPKKIQKIAEKEH